MGSQSRLDAFGAAERFCFRLERNLKEILQEFQRIKAGTLKKSCLDQEIEVEVGLQEDNGCIWTSCSNHTLTSCIRGFEHLD